MVIQHFDSCFRYTQVFKKISPTKSPNRLTFSISGPWPIVSMKSELLFYFVSASARLSAFVGFLTVHFRYH